MEIRQSIVGFLAAPESTYKFAGTGFLAEGGVLVTCAHVLDGARRDGEAYLFQFDGENETRHAFLIRQSARDDLDLAVLKPQSLPSDAAPLKLVRPANIRKLEFSVYGYPQKAGFHGRYADGKIQGALKDVNGREAFQIKSEQIEKGFSGAPLYVDEFGGVVAIVSRGPGSRFGLADQVTAYAIPVEQLELVYSRFTIQPGQAASKGWYMAHHYGLRPNFTGRIAEREMLSAWLKDEQNTLFILRALGGFGKSALSWHWLHNDVSAADFPNVVWWSFYEGDASFDSFLSDTLEYLGVKDANKMNPRQQVHILLGQLQDAGILLVLDGFERTLRAFSGMGAAYQGDVFPLPMGEGQGEGDSGASPHPNPSPARRGANEGESRGRDCVSPAAEDFLRGLNDPKLRGKLLMTTRLCPHVLETHDGELQPRCRQVELKALTPADAFIFFTEKEKIKATRAEVQAACAPYDYHPLSLNLLAGLIKKDFEFRGDIKAAEKYKIIGDIRNHQEHILKASYETLPAERQQLLSKIACFRGSVDYASLKTIFAPAHLDEALTDLQERGLIQVTTLSSSNFLISAFDLHPIVRRYAYDRLTAPDKTAAHQCLADYFAAVPQPPKVEKLDDLAPVIELYHHMVRAGKFDDAIVLFRDKLAATLYFQFGAYQQVSELLVALFPDDENKSPRLKDDAWQAWTLSLLANAYALSGQPRRAVPLFEIQNTLQEKAGDKKNLAIGLGNVATQQLVIGALAQAERNLRRSIDLGREIGDEFKEAVGHQNLGRVLSYRGAWQAAEQELDAGLKLFEKQHAVQSEGVVWAYRALRHLLAARSNPKSKIQNLKSAIECAKRALELADEDTRQRYPHPRDYVRAHWLLGAAYRVSGVSTSSTTDASTGSARAFAEAETHLGEALRRCRAINMVDHEADILLEVAKLRHAQQLFPREPGEPQGGAEALRLAREALVITERSGYVLQGADVHLWLATLALEGVGVDELTSNKECALLHAKKARELAECDGGEYTYKVAYDEAGALLERLKAEGLPCEVPAKGNQSKG